MTEEEKKENLRKLSLGEIRVRLAVVTKVIREAQSEKDPRWKNVVPQQRRLNQVLVEKIREARQIKGEPEPEPVTVGVKVLRMTTKRIRL